MHLFAGVVFPNNRCRIPEFLVIEHVDIAFGIEFQLRQR